MSHDGSVMQRCDTAADGDAVAETTATEERDDVACAMSDEAVASALGSAATAALARLWLCLLLLHASLLVCGGAREACTAGEECGASEASVAFNVVVVACSPFFFREIVGTFWIAKNEGE